MLDGDITQTDRAAMHAHLATCEVCQVQLAAFEQLDAALRVAVPSISLDDSFDARLWAQLDPMDDSSRELARQRLEQELRDNLEALSRRRRRSLALVIPGVIAGIALVGALLGWLDGSGIGQQLARAGADEFGRQAGTYVQTLLLALVGAGIALGIGSWLVRAVE